MQTLDLRPTQSLSVAPPRYASDTVSLADDTDVGLQAVSTAKYPFVLEGSSDGEEWFALDLQTMSGAIVNQVAVPGIYRLKAPIVTNLRITCGEPAQASSPFAIVTLP